MIICKVHVCLNEERKSGYFPTWQGNNIEGQHGAKLLISEKSGESILVPLVPSIFENVQIGDKLYCFEGLTKIGYVTVIDLWK